MADGQCCAEDRSRVGLLGGSTRQQPTRRQRRVGTWHVTQGKPSKARKHCDRHGHAGPDRGPDSRIRGRSSKGGTPRATGPARRTQASRSAGTSRGSGRTGATGAAGATGFDGAAGVSDTTNDSGNIPLLRGGVALAPAFGACPSGTGSTFLTVTLSDSFNYYRLCSVR